MKTRPSHLVLPLLTLAAISGAGCSASAQVGSRTAEPFQWQGQMTAGSTLEIKGVNGPVEAVAATGNRAQIRVTRSGRRSNPSEVEIVVVEHSGGYTVCAVYPSSGAQRNECRPGTEGRISARNNDVQVAFIIEVPAGVDFVARTTNGDVTARNLTSRVEARSTNGDVEIDGASTARARTTNGSVVIRAAGEADASTTNGRITAQLRNLDGTVPLRFATTNGSITLTLPGDARANILATTTNGQIRTDLPLTILGSVGRRQVEGTLGGGGREIRLSTTNGSIRLEQGSR